MNSAIKRNSFFLKLLEVVLEEKRREVIKSGLIPEGLKCDKKPSFVTLRKIPKGDYL